MKKEQITRNMPVKVKGGKEGKVKKVGMIFIKVELDDGTILWVSSAEIEKK